MKSAALLLCLLFATAAQASAPNALRNRIPHDTVIQGHPCAKGEAWFYPDGSLNQCTLARPATVGDVRVPRRSLIELWPDGAAQHVTFRHPTVVAGYHVRGSSRIGISRGITATFYRNGNLRSIYLTADQMIQGVPCHGGSWNTFTDPTGAGNLVEFYEDGKLASCKLSHDYIGFRLGERLVLPHLDTAAEYAGSSSSR
jgi:hypothetical protein